MDHSSLENHCSVQEKKFLQAISSFLQIKVFLDHPTPLVMDSIFEIRANIKFCFKLGKSVIETYKLLKKAYGDEALSYGMVHKWFRKFKSGQESLQDDPRVGRPIDTRTEENIQKIAKILDSDKRISIRLLEDMTGIQKDTIHTILVQDLKRKKVNSRFVPHLITDEQKLARMQHCIDMQNRADNDPTFMKTIVTGDETWCYQYDPLTKRQSAEWLEDGDPKPKKCRMQKSRVKTLLTVFFDSRGIIHQEFTPEGVTVTGEYYLSVVDRLLKRIHRVRPEYRRNVNWTLLHDNAPAHKSLVVRNFLAKKGVVVLEHPPYSPDLAPADFWLFPKLKLSLKGTRFDSISEIQKTVTRDLKALQPDAFSKCFDAFYRRFQRCYLCNGDYFD